MPYNHKLKKIKIKNKTQNKYYEYDPIALPLTVLIH